jgi:divalent metal cation (Fe/Co/Zn/Cd) transporter
LRRFRARSVALAGFGLDSLTEIGASTVVVWELVMFAPAAGKTRMGQPLDNPVLRTEGRVTMIDGILAVAVLAALVVKAALGWWWADPGRRLRAGVLRRP